MGSGRIALLRAAHPELVEGRRAFFYPQHGVKKMEERVGFEPTIPIPRNNGFQDRRIRPLCHLS